MAKVGPPWPLPAAPCPARGRPAAMACIMPEQVLLLAGMVPATMGGSLTWEAEGGNPKGVGRTSLDVWP